MVKSHMNITVAIDTDADDIVGIGHIAFILSASYFMINRKSMGRMRLILLPVVIMMCAFCSVAQVRLSEVGPGYCVASADIRLLDALAEIVVRPAETTSEYSGGP